MEKERSEGVKESGRASANCKLLGSSFKEFRHSLLKKSAGNIEALEDVQQALKDATPEGVESVEASLKHMQKNRDSMESLHKEGLKLLQVVYTFAASHV